MSSTSDYPNPTPQRTETLIPSPSQPLGISIRGALRNFDFGSGNSRSNDSNVYDDAENDSAPMHHHHHLPSEDSPLMLLSNTPPSSPFSKTMQMILYIVTSSYAMLLFCIGLFVVSVGYLALVLVLNQKDALPQDVFERAQYVARFQVPLIDGHNDWPNRVDRLERILGHELDLRQRLNESTREYYISIDEELHTDIPRLHDGEMRAQVWSVFASCHSKNPVQEAIRQFETVFQLVERYSDELVFAYSSEDVWRLYHTDNRVISMIGVEGGHMLGLGDYRQLIRVLQTFYRLGARYMTLTHSCDTQWAKSHDSTNASMPGLTPLGEQIVWEMNRMGMMVDLAHVHWDTMYHVFRISKAPVIFSHSSVWEICHSTRNVNNELIDLAAEKGAVIMINYFSLYISDPEREKFAEVMTMPGNYTYDERVAIFKKWEDENPELRATIETVCDHIDYIRQRTGNTKHIGIGADFDGVFTVPVGLEDVSKHYRIGGELYKRGYSDEEVRDIFGGNFLRVMAEVERVGREIRGEEGPFVENRVEQHGMEDRVRRKIEF